MKPPQTGKKDVFFLCFLLALSAILTLTGCSVTPHAQTPVNMTPLTASGQATPGQSQTATPTASFRQSAGPQTPILHGPTNFLLNAPFTFTDSNGATTDNNGNVIPLDAPTIQKEVTQELQYLLFVVDTSNNIKVYGRGTSPVSARLTLNTDSSVTISYTQTVDSEAGTISIIFNAHLSSKQIAVNYEQEYTPSMLINAQASDIDVTFTTHLEWVAPDQIPAAPDNGAYRLTAQGGVALKWTGGQHAVAYDVYRLVSDQNQQFQLLATVKDTTYIDNSNTSIQNIHATKGITYAIFSVGPTGVENPGGIVLSIAAQ